MGAEGRRAHIPDKLDIPKVNFDGGWKREVPAKLPEVSELELVRHIVRLSQMNHGVDVGSYPLGSCTMKYNPKVNLKETNDEVPNLGFSLSNNAN